jgi:hydroxymethylglutaryl-CoA synthase
VYACLHSPYNKLVQKGFARMVGGDLASEPSRPEWSADAEAQKWAKVPASESVNDREAEKAYRRLAEPLWGPMCSDTHTLSKQIGNCYTAAVYMNLISLVSNRAAELTASGSSKILMFSYGSGAVGTAFILVARNPDGHNSLSAGGAPFTLARMAQTCAISERLASREERDVAAFEAALDLRARRLGTAGFEPSGSIEELPPGAYYLVRVDEQHRRTYARKSPKAQ